MGAWDMFSAGSETSASTIEWAMSEMLRNPGVMEKAQTEVRKACKGKRQIEEMDIENLDYLKLVVKETLRLHPLGALIPRECREECEISGFEIPVKAKVLINAWAIGRDPKYWKDADSFQPERFQESEYDFRVINFHYFPFGAGRRMCPGISFAIALVELALAQLLYHFDWKLDGVKPENLDMTEAFGLIARRKNNLYAVATTHIPIN